MVLIGLAVGCLADVCGLGLIDWLDCLLFMLACGACGVYAVDVAYIC